jgi:hypothetical protein
VQGIPVSTVDPINGQVLVYNEATLQYEPAVATTGVNEITLGTAAVGTVAEVSTFTFIGDPETWQGQYFTIGVPTGQAYVWFNKDGSAGDPAPAGFIRGVVIDAGDVSGSPEANRNSWASQMVAVFASDPDLSASRSGDVITLTSRANGTRSNIALVTISGSDASVAVVTEGVSVGGVLGSVVLRSENARADVSIKNIDGNVRFDRALGNIALGNGSGTIVSTGDFGTGVATALAKASNDTGGIVLAGGTSSLNIIGTVGASNPQSGSFSSITLSKTITAIGTTGARTINNATGSVNFASTATSLVVTNNLVTVNSVIQVSKATNNSTARLGAVVAAAGSFTIYMDVAPTATTRVNFLVTN